MGRISYKDFLKGIPGVKLEFDVGAPNCGFSRSASYCSLLVSTGSGTERAGLSTTMQERVPDIVKRVYH